MEAETSIPNEPENSKVESTILSSRALYQHDPLLLLLKDKLHLSTFWIIAGGFVLGGLSTSTFTTYFRSDFRPTVSLGDALILLLLVIASTLSLLIYLVLPASMASIFNTLRANGVIGLPRQERLGSMSYAHFLDHVVAWVDSRWWSIVLVMYIILSYLYTIFITTPQFLAVPPVWLLVYFVLGFLPFQYALGFVTLRVILLLIFVNRLFFLFSIRVRPLHADGSGGLAALSQISWMIAGIVFVATLLGFAIPGHITAPISPFEYITLTIAYSTLIIVAAIGWLALPHHVMVQARNEHLQPLTEEYERVLMQVRPAAADEETAQIVAGTERLSALKQRYELVRDTFPTWPLQIVQMRRLAIALLVPALLSLLPVLLEAFVKK